MIGASVGAVYHLSGDTAGDIRALRRCMKIDSNFVMSHYFLRGALRDSGDLVAAEASLRTAIEKSGGTPEVIAGLAQTLARARQANEARALLAELAATAQACHVSPCLAAQVHAALGKVGVAVDALERAAVLHDPEIVFIGVRPAYAPMHGDARFIALRQRVGV